MNTNRPRSTSLQRKSTGGHPRQGRRRDGGGGSFGNPLPRVARDPEFPQGVPEHAPVDPRIALVAGKAVRTDAWPVYDPTITLGAQFKYNDGIKSINSRLGGALEGIGYKRQTGEDFTLTATKLIPKVLGRPLVLTAGGRVSSAAQLRFLGFSNHWAVTFEGHVLYLPTDWLAVAYEFARSSRRSRRSRSSRPIRRSFLAASPARTRSR